MKEKCNSKKEIAKVVGVLMMFLLLAVFGQFIVGCSPKVYPSAEVRDSTKVVIRERVVHDTVTFEIEKEKEIVVTKDTASVLENTYAKSEARVEAGMLRHTLETKPHKVYVPVTTVVHDTVTITKQAEKVVVTEKVNYLTRWQSFMIVLGYIIGGLLLLIVIGWIVKRFVL